MKTYKASGLALRSMNLGEADKIITFMTDGGRKDAVAKGVRRPKSKFGGRLEPGNDLELVLATGRNLDTVIGVQVRKLRPWIRSDLRKIELAFNILEMADKFGSEDSPDLRLLALTRAALDNLESESRLLLLRLAYDLKVVAISGFLPNLVSCVGCGGTGAFWLSTGNGGLACEDCRNPGDTKRVEAGTVELLRQLLTVKFAELDSVQTTASEVAAANEMIWLHIRYHVAASFKTRDRASEMGIG